MARPVIRAMDNLACSSGAHREVGGGGSQGVHNAEKRDECKFSLLYM